MPLSLPVPAQRWFHRHPETGSDALQLVKCVLATVAAWWLATHVLSSELTFLAPWTALMTVHATIYRTVNRGLQTLVATALGLAVTALVTAALGVTPLSLAVAVTAGLLASRLPVLREEGLAVATTALFIMAEHEQHDLSLMADRVSEVVLGVGVGLVVNALLVPPLRRRQAETYVEEIHRRMGSLLTGMADELRGSWDTDRSSAWIARTEEMDGLLESAWGQVRLSRESARWNPRVHGTTGARDPAAMLERLHEGVSHLRHLVRTLDEATMADERWDEEFRRRWTDLAMECGRRLADPSVEPTEPADALDHLTQRLSRSDLPHLHWPVYGALITSLRHITRIADDVADSRQLRPAAG